MILLVVVVQLPSHVPFFATPWTAACQASLSLIMSQSLPKFMSIELMMLSNHLILCHLLLLQSFLASGSFSVSWVFTSGGQNISASSPALPMNIQGLFPLGLTGLVSLSSKGLSRLSSSIAVGKHLLFFSIPYDSTNLRYLK